MKKIILETLLGLILAAGGIGLIFFGITSLSDTPAIIAIGIGALLVCVSVYLLYRAGTTDVHKPDFVTDVFHPKAEQEPGVLQKNSRLVSEYYKTVEARDKLKLLKMSATDEGQSGN